MPWGIQIYFMAEVQKTNFKAALLTHVIDHGKHHHLLLKFFNVFNYTESNSQSRSHCHGCCQIFMVKTKDSAGWSLHIFYKRTAFNERTAFPGLKLVHGRIVTNVSFCL